MIDSQKLIAAITLQPTQAAFLCRVAALEDPKRWPQVHEADAVCLLLGDLLLQHGLEMDAAFTVVAEAKKAIVDYVEGEQAKLFTVQLLDGLYAAWPGLEQPMNIQTFQFEDPPKQLPIYSLAISITGFVRVVLPGLVA